MLYHWAAKLKLTWSFLNIIHYISVRSMCALLTSLGISLLLGDRFIRMAQKRFASTSREFTPDTHLVKESTPTIGGGLILGTTLISLLLWGNLLGRRLWLVILNLIAFGLIGLWDDWAKLRHRRGISSRHKFGLQLLAAGLVVTLWGFFLDPNTTLVLPFLKHLQPELGFWFYLWAIFVLIGSSNAVNLTDGLDGLATSSLITNFGVFAFVAYAAGHTELANYLQIPFAGSAELTIVCGALLGACLGFLWFNAYPAQIFMGDIGSVALGATLGLIALMTKQELILVISGGLFVVETISVIMQVLSFKICKRRIFRMAPIHHHFELLGCPETKITIRFAIISIILSLLALMTLKIR